MMDDTPLARYRLASLTDRPALARLALIGMVIVCVAGGFVYTAGWFSPDRLTQSRLIDTFERVNGRHAGFRRNHAKGVCVAGNFGATARAHACPRPPCSRRAACRWSDVSPLPAAIPSWPTARGRSAAWP